jgi:hypothetical protein
VAPTRCVLTQGTPILWPFPPPSSGSILVHFANAEHKVPRLRPLSSLGSIAKKDNFRIWQTHRWNRLEFFVTKCQYTGLSRQARIADEIEATDITPVDLSYLDLSQLLIVGPFRIQDLPTSLMVEPDAKFEKMVYY